MGSQCLGGSLKKKKYIVLFLFATKGLFGGGCGSLNIGEMARKGGHQGEQGGRRNGSDTSYRPDTTTKKKTYIM